MNETDTLMMDMSKVQNTVLYYEQRIKGYAYQRCQKWCWWLLFNTVYRVMVHMSKVLKVYSVYRGPLTLQEGRLPAFHLVGLVVHQSEEADLLTFQD